MSIYMFVCHIASFPISPNTQYASWEAELRVMEREMDQRDRGRIGEEEEEDTRVDDTPLDPYERSSDSLSSTLSHASSLPSPPATAMQAPPSTAVGIRDQSSFYQNLSSAWARHEIVIDEEREEDGVEQTAMSPPRSMCVESENFMQITYNDDTQKSSPPQDQQSFNITVQSEEQLEPLSLTHSIERSSRSSSNRHSTKSSTRSSLTTTFPPPNNLPSLDSSLYVPDHLQSNSRRRSSGNERISGILLPKLSHSGSHTPTRRDDESSSSSSSHPVPHHASRNSLPDDNNGNNVIEQAAERLRKEMHNRRQSLPQLVTNGLPPTASSAGASPNPAKRDSPTLSNTRQLIQERSNNHALRAHVHGVALANNLEPLQNTRALSGGSLTNPPSSSNSRSTSPLPHPPRPSAAAMQGNNSTSTGQKSGTSSPGSQFLNRPSTPYGSSAVTRRRSLPPIGLSNIKELNAEAKQAQE